MDFINATTMQADYTLGVDPSAREHVVVAIKGTFDFPVSGNDPTLAEKQVPLVEADEFTGEPGKSATVYEADFPLRKPRCDVLLNGSAYAPNGKLTKKVQVGMKIGPMAKAFNVVGDRLWQSRGMTVLPGDPSPFTVMPISYDRAYGGTDDLHPDPKKHSAYRLNPVGRGYHKQTGAELIDGTPLPNTEESDSKVNSPSGSYRPMSFGSIGRGWTPRLELAGTYDDAWLADRFPFLPPDFQEAHYQSAPTEQQIANCVGGEEVVLVNLTPSGREKFTLPRIELPVAVRRRGSEQEVMRACLDTIYIEPDQRRIMLTWRSTVPLSRNIFEIREVIVGRYSRAWWSARVANKQYFPSLGALVRSKRDSEQSMPADE